MILSSLFIVLDWVTPSIDYTYGFRKKSHSLCNYLEREVLKEIKYNCEGFNRIVISMSAKPEAHAFVNSSQVAGVELPYQPQKYDHAHGDALNRYFVDCLDKGLKKLSDSHAIPYAELMAGATAFLDGGGKNEWLHKSRTFRQQKVKANLQCALSHDAFQLTLQVWRNSRVVFDHVILETEPDALAYGYRFKDITLVDGVLSVTGKNDQLLFRRRLDKLTGV